MVMVLHTTAVVVLLMTEIISQKDGGTFDVMMILASFKKMRQMSLDILRPALRDIIT
jgi:hypothetical protein